MQVSINFIGTVYSQLSHQHFIKGYQYRVTKCVHGLLVVFCVNHIQSCKYNVFSHICTRLYHGCMGQLTKASYTLTHHACKQIVKPIIILIYSAVCN